MKKIVIEQGNEFKIYTRESNLNEDIFSEQYQLAKKIIDNLKNYRENIEQNHQWNDNLEHLNNLIAFCGDRGQGKSSAMIQFTRSLKEDKDIEVLETIDPTAMETVHDILDIVVSRMFNQFIIDKTRMNQIGDELSNNIFVLDRDNQLSMLALFQKVHKNLAVLKNSDKFIKDEYIYNGSIQNLTDIANSMKLKQDFEKLVKDYLKYKKKKMLAFSLDDLDLNISAAYKMMEQIRKYIMLPEIIIVMALNISQLSLCVERQFLLEMKGLEQSVRWNMYQEAKNMANKYLEKLLPLPRRIILPDIRTISSGGRSAVEIVFQNEKDIIFDSNTLGIEKGLMKLLYKRTGVLLVAVEDEVHPMIPSTLRELVGLVSVIGNMEENDRKKNVELFEDYLFDFWVESHLKEKERQWFISLREVGYKGVHKTIFFYLYDWLTKNGYLNGEVSHKSPLTIAVEKSYSYLKRSGGTISNGKLLNCIRLCYKAKDYGLSKLVFAINAYLSILMLKLMYDHAEEKLIDFIGGNIFGSNLLIREETGIGANRSRMSYEYSLSEYWRHYGEEYVKADTVTDFEKINVNSVKKYFNQFKNGDEALKQSLYTIGCVSSFQWTSDSAAVGMVSDNNMLATKAEFSLNNLFIRQVGDDSIYNYIHAEKWGIKEQEYENIIPIYWKHFRELCKILLCNMEAIIYISQYLLNTRDIKTYTNNDIRVYYNHFFKSLIEGMLKLNQYLELDINWMKESDNEYNQLVEELALFWESIKREKTEAEEDEWDEIESTEQKSLFDMFNISHEPLNIPNKYKSTIPSYVRKDSSIENFSNKFKQLNNYIDKFKQFYSVELINDINIELEELRIDLIEYIEKGNDKVIGGEFSERYNNIRHKLL